MYISRIAEKNLLNIIDRKGKVGIILGARQVGKTTLVRHVVKGRKTLELNFDVEVDKSRFLAAASLSPSHAYKYLGEPEILVIDEAQRIPETSRIVKGWIDKDFGAKILLLGSSSLNLLDQSAESLTGRNLKLILSPLTFKESLGAFDWFDNTLPRKSMLDKFAGAIRTALLESMVFGGYPEIVISSQKEELLRELSSDYLWKDILVAGLVKSPDALRKLLCLLAHQAGSEVSVNELATQLHIARATVERYIELLEQTFVIFRLSAFSNNMRKEISKNKKIYFWDTGIRNALLGDFNCSASRPDIGRLWENWCVAEIAKWKMLSGNHCELFFWRTRSQSEVDLVIRSGLQLRAFDAKWGGGKVKGRAFKDAYGIDVELLSPDNPFIDEILV